MGVKVDRDLCTGCGDCIDACPTQTLEIVGDKAEVVNEDCIDCLACIDTCPEGAIEEE
jgi:electron transfer flavoprotein alpha subunit